MYTCDYPFFFCLFSFLCLQLFSLFFLCYFFSPVLPGPGVAEADENCVKFLERTMPCAFDKVLYPH